MYRSHLTGTTDRSQLTNCTERICILLQTQPDSSKSIDNGPNCCI